MKLSRDWIADHVDLDGVSDTDLARRLTEIGHAVEGTESHGDDTVFEIEFTANRLDAMSHRGVAREIAAAMERELRPMPAAAPAPAEGTEFSVRIDVPEMCSRYTGFLLRGINVKPSPAKMRERLEAVGLRPINNIVDITNYLMVGLGHPLHAFDFDLLENHQIVVRAGKPGETIESLDGVERKIDSETVVIADGARAVALGGVIGGANSEIGDSTRNVLLECAHFTPAVIRRTARRLGIRTDASYRFERGVDPADTLAVIREAAAMILREAGGEAVEIVDVIAREPEHPRVTLRNERLEMFSAGTVGPGYALDLFRRLGMEAEPVDGGVETVIPTWRGDLSEEIDLVEEVLRFHGYGRVPASLPRLTTGDVRHLDLQDAEDRVRDLLVGSGSTEVVTYSFIHPDQNSIVSDEQPIDLTNALTENVSSMRISLLPGLLDVVHHNLSYGIRDGSIFEVGRSYHPEAGSVHERREAAFLLWGNAESHWGDAKRAADYFDVKGMVEAIAGRFHVNLRFEAAGASWLKPGEGVARSLEIRSSPPSAWWQNRCSRSSASRRRWLQASSIWRLWLAGPANGRCGRPRSTPGFRWCCVCSTTAI